MNETIRILLVNDSPTLLAGLRCILEPSPDVTVLGEASDSKTALELIEAMQPDVVLLDCQMTGMTSRQIAAAIQKMCLPVNILAFSAHDDDESVRGMVDADAVGYLLKDEPPERITDAVRAAARGEGWFSQAIAAQMATWVRTDSTDSTKLTERELDVLRLLVQGKSNPQIASELCITERTLRYHLGNIYAKLGVHSDREAIVWAINHYLGKK